MVETGTHQQLIKSKGVYANMWQAQNGEALEQGRGSTVIVAPTATEENMIGK